MNRIDRFFEPDEPFSGYEFDSDTGAYYVQFRSYDPTVGRWLSTEPVSLDETAGDKEA